MRQYRSEGVDFQPERVRAGARLPRTLMDSVADNLVRNALAKRAADRSVRIIVSLSLEGEVVLRVTDTGSAIAQDVAKCLLRGPVASPAGLGIGLYQAARQAEAAGYSLALEANRDGEVCFALKGGAS
jgi:C4-dicarboxylate-specific signal transduction histidine kinase